MIERGPVQCCRNEAPFCLPGAGTVAKEACLLIVIACLLFTHMHICPARSELFVWCQMLACLQAPKSHSKILQCTSTHLVAAPKGQLMSVCTQVSQAWDLLKFCNVATTLAALICLEAEMHSLASMVNLDAKRI